MPLYAPHSLWDGSFRFSRSRCAHVSIVARIAYNCSDIVLSVQPALGLDSEFSRTLHTLASKKTTGIVAKQPEVHHIIFVTRTVLMIF